MTNSWLSRVLYWNMNYHIEHHLYPSIPFHALPALNAAIRDQLPEPSPSRREAEGPGKMTILSPMPAAAGSLGQH